MKKKALSLVLSAAMVLSLAVPVSAVSVSNFGDVPSDSWYYDSVRYVAEKDYMNGTSATTFEPNSDMTRAMFATLISRVAGAEVDNSAASEFTDVVSGQWYTGAIEWGVENELITGYGNGLFGTNDSITRQDIAVLTQRFLDWYCAENNKSLNFEPLVENFTDADSIADYAQEAVEFCREAGLLTGYEDGSFRPLGTATRAEIAAIVERIEFIMESASPAVVYTDTEGNRATLEIAVGDVITVDPNNGSVTYDGTTHRDEFTITATEEGITLPDATRSGYRFDGWKVETDANGAYTFTAQWTRTSSGGGGGGGNEPVTPLPDDAVFRDYTISLFNLGKVGSSITGEEIKIHDGTNIYHVAFDSKGNYLEDHSDDILWTDIAKDTFNDANLRKIFNSITLPIEVGDEVVVTEDWIIPEVTVQQVKIVNLIGELEEDEKEKLLVGTPLEGKVAELNNILTALDEGSSELLTSDQVTVVSNISQKLTDMIGETIVDPATGESVNRLYYEVVQRVDQSTLDNLGLDSDDIITMVQDYTAKLDQIVDNRSQRSGGNADTTDTNTTGGVEVKVNPVNVLKAQYEENVDDLLNTALNEVGITDGTKRADVIELLHDAGVIGACDPDLFFNPEGVQDSDGEYREYSLLLDGSGDVDTQTYSNRIADIIDAVEDARGQLHGVLEESDIDSVIANISSKVQDKLGEDADSILDKIDANSEPIRNLILQPDTPTLVDVLNISGDAQTEGVREVEGSITLEASDINTLLDKILNSSGSEDLQGSELVTSLVNKLSGTYTFGISINVDRCSDYDPDTNPDPGVH